MTTQCQLCGQPHASEAVTITDDSGASLVAVCTGCLELLDTPRCWVCGDLASDEHPHSAYFDGETPPGEEFPVCCSCRISIITGTK